MTSGGITESFKLVILKRQVEHKMSDEFGTLAKLHRKKVCIEDKCYVFATTMSDSWIDVYTHRVAEFYRQRWSIENSYKSYEDMRPWTTSNIYTVRIMLWFIPFVQLVGDGTFPDRQRNHNERSPCPLHLFVSCILSEINVQAKARLEKSGKPPD